MKRKRNFTEEKRKAQRRETENSLKGSREFAEKKRTIRRKENKRFTERKPNANTGKGFQPANQCSRTTVSGPANRTPHPR
ncbi:hypothetical protein [Bacteroides pyogenes]|uniref:hypothetical protein n=1 Tax=Bacteroides pyogenes TaxID=310300 RepID=UPI0011C0454F|nr:hypothetical protein [Bacteroides pyogenes]MBB3894885.1 hypothetical protein [Bacteroides pyogenes]